MSGRRQGDQLNRSVLMDSLLPCRLWGPSSVENKADIGSGVICEGEWMKVKDGGQMTSRHFILTCDKLYYAATEESEDKIRGELSLAFVFVEFVDKDEDIVKELNNSFMAEQGTDTKESEGKLSGELLTRSPEVYSKKGQISSDQLAVYGQHASNEIKHVSSVPLKFSSSGNYKYGTKGYCRKVSLNDQDRETELKVLEGGAVHLSKGERDQVFLHNLIAKTNPKRVKRLSCAIGQVFNQELEEDKKTKDKKEPYLIRFTQGKLFTEIATFNRAQFSTWKWVLRPLCLQTNFQNFYRVEELLVQSARSKIYLISETSGLKGKYTAKAISIKEIIEDEEAKEKALHEIEVYKGLVHKNIVELHEVFEDKLSLTLIFEYIQGPSIEKTYKLGFRYSTADIVCFLRECIETLQFIHSQGVFHRDINPMTVLLRNSGKVSPDNGPVFIGLSRALKLNSHIKPEDCLCGRIGFIAPELYSVQDDNSQINNIDFAKVDVYGVGMVLYCLMSGEDPCHRSDLTNPPKLFNARFEQFRSKLKNYVKMLLDIDPTKRPSVNELLRSELLSLDNIRRYKNKRARENKSIVSQSKGYSSISSNSAKGDTSIDSSAKKKLRRRLSRNKLPTQINMNLISKHNNFGLQNHSSQRDIPTSPYGSNLLALEGPTSDSKQPFSPISKFTLQRANTLICIDNMDPTPLTPEDKNNRMKSLLDMSPTRINKSIKLSPELRVVHNKVTAIPLRPRRMRDIQNNT